MVNGVYVEQSGTFDVGEGAAGANVKSRPIYWIIERILAKTQEIYEE